MSVSVEDLENFVVSSQPDLEIIKSNLSAFNIFNVLGIQHREIRHSNFLGWLFDPNESHQLGDVFLRDLFKLMRKINVLKADYFMNFLLQDLSDTQVYRESVHNIDILIVNKSLELVICIENKIYADYSDHQLEKYHKYVEENYGGIKTRIYLTLTPFKNDNHENYIKGKKYKNISYQSIVTLLKVNKNSIDKSIPTVRESINQYIAMVEKSVTNSSAEVQLAQSIYKKYKNEIDFIVRNQLNFIKYTNIISGLIMKDDSLVFSHNFKGNNALYVLPISEKLRNLFKIQNAKSRGGDYIFSIVIMLSKNSINLKFGFGNIENAIDSKTAETIKNRRTQLYNSMYQFNSFKNTNFAIEMGDNAGGNADFATVCEFPLFNEKDFFANENEFSDAFKQKLEEVKIELIEPWVAECLVELS